MAPFSKIRGRLLFRLVVSLVLLTGALLFLAWQIFRAGKSLSEEEILSVLPKGSVIAMVPVRFAENGGVAETRKAIVQVDGLMGGDGEILVGYHTEPDNPKGKQPSTTFEHRTHVAVVGRTQGKPELLWDSGAFGFYFGMERLYGTTFSDGQISLFFGARDLNGDKKFEIFFSRISTDAEGTEFEIWHFDPKRRVLQQVLATDGYVELLSESQAGWPVIRARSFEASEESDGTYRFDEKSEHYVCTKSVVTPENAP
jgi:hypothetical protein